MQCGNLRLAEGASATLQQKPNLALFLEFLRKGRGRCEVSTPGDRAVVAQQDDRTKGRYRFHRGGQFQGARRMVWRHWHACDPHREIGSEIGQGIRFGQVLQARECRCIRGMQMDDSACLRGCSIDGQMEVDLLSGLSPLTCAPFSSSRDSVSVSRWPNEELVGVARMASLMRALMLPALP